MKHASFGVTQLYYIRDEKDSSKDLIMELGCIQNSISAFNLLVILESLTFEARSRQMRIKRANNFNENQPIQILGIKTEKGYGPKRIFAIVRFCLPLDSNILFFCHFA